MFEGIIPSEISKLKNLRELRLEENGLSGSLPQSIGEATALGNYIFSSIFDINSTSTLFVLSICRSNFGSHKCKLEWSTTGFPVQVDNLEASRSSW